MAAVGFVLGLVLTSCLIEIIYHFDFTKLFANPVQTVIGGAIAILVVGVFWMDVLDMIPIFRMKRTSYPHPST